MSLRLSQSDAAQDFVEPVKKIHDGADLEFFLQTLAYRDVMTFMLQLNRSVVPRKQRADGVVHEFRLQTFQQEDLLPQVTVINELIEKLQAFVKDAPPDTGPRRFGNVSFRKWYKFVEDAMDEVLTKALPSTLHSSIVELKAYLLGSFGSAQRLDYGTGHELSFLAFLAALWKLDYFSVTRTEGTGTSFESKSDSHSLAERQIVLVLFRSYFELVRDLIQTYNLEPAGSHGVWGLDDNSFLPYIFGSAQLASAIPEDESGSAPSPTPTSGSLPSAVDPSMVTKPNQVKAEAKSNLYFSAIQFIYTVKRGPFWEHSPMLFDISGVKDGWGKINKGLIKMYDVEVLGKFPVVQHFVFGSIFKWEKDPNAKPVPQSASTTSSTLRDPMANSRTIPTMRPGPGPGAGTAAPWASAGGQRAVAPPPGFVNGVTQAPWTRHPGNRDAPQMSAQNLPSNRGGYSVSLLQGPARRPVSTALAQEVKLANKTAETIEESKETGDET